MTTNINGTSVSTDDVTADDVTVTNKTTTGTLEADDSTIGTFASPNSSQSISSNSISFVSSFIKINGEDGTNLTTINDPVEGARCVIQSLVTTTIEHGTDNIRLDNNSNYAVDSGDTLELIYDGSNWTEIGRADR